MGMSDGGSGETRNSSTLLVVLLIVAILAAGGAGFLYYQETQTTTELEASLKQEQSRTADLRNEARELTAERNEALIRAWQATVANNHMRVCVGDGNLHAGSDHEIVSAHVYDDGSVVLVLHYASEDAGTNSLTFGERQLKYFNTENGNDSISAYNEYCARLKNDS